MEAGLQYIRSRQQQRQMKAKLGCLKISRDKADSPNQFVQRRQTAGDVGAGRKKLPLFECLQEGPGATAAVVQPGDRRQTLGWGAEQPAGPGPTAGTLVGAQCGV